ncbi:MAG TPA: hypothetical protein VFJ85_07390 [Acidimicrobiales bacterium]|nr:hypothetical protein [Acidimicrobiales bacterium]
MTGWRYWQVHPSTGLLRSVTHRGVTWQPGQPMRAVCLNGGHDAPATGCACGLHAAPSLERLRDDSLCLRPGEALVVGEAALWGTVVTDDHGIRAGRGYPRRLWVVAPPGPAGAGGALDRYGVPVGVMAAGEAVGEVAAAILAYQSMSG